MALAISYSQQSASGTLAERAMLVDLTIRQWSATASDKTANRATAAAHGADESMTRFSKLLIKSDSLDAIRKIATAASAEHRTRTLPWLDSGARILSSAGYFDYAQAMRGYEDAWAVAVAAFIDHDYDIAIRDAQRQLGSLFSWRDYPTEGQLRKRFAFGYNVLPLPSADDFRVALGSEQVALIRSQIEAATQAALESALADVYERVQDVVGRMSERLRAYQPAAGADKAQGVFRDTLVENVRDLVGLLPSLNVTGNYRLAQLAQRMDTELLQYSADTLRVNQRAREEVASAAEDILAKMSDFV